nr:AsmA family protein [Bacteroidota bacterium]
MKKVLMIFGGIVLFLLLVAILVPILFKDQIKAKIDAELAKTVNADINLQTKDFSLSILRNFPNATASLNNFSVVGKDEFKGDTLISAKSFKVIINIKSLLGDKIAIKGIDIQSPRMLVKVLENGKANYDIMIGDKDEPVEETEPSEFSIGIDSWNIEKGYIVYDDRSMHLYTILDDFNHSGSGDFTQDVFDLNTKTRIGAVTVNYEKTEYLTRKRIESDLALNMNLPESKYTFKENTVKVNDFAFGFDGYVAMPGDDFDVDITYGAKDNSFKSILSLVPGIYKDGYENIKAEGNVNFNGFVKGVYSESRNLMPAYNFKLAVDNAMFQYPDLPTAIKNINLNMMVDNKDGAPKNNILDISQFHMDMGSNPVDAKVRVEGIETPNILANIKAKLNLAELTNMFPIEGTQLKGLYNIDLTASGVYDSATSRMPSVMADMSLANGYVKSSEFPAPLENVNFVSKVENKTGKMEDTEIWVNDYNMVLDGERLSARLYLKDLNDYTWDAAVNGVVDLDKMTKIFPLDSMELSGKITANIQTKGRMSDLEAERYEKLPTSGVMSLNNFKYVSHDFPQGFLVNTASMRFDPDRMVISNFNGAVGKTDMQIDGFVSNYMGYMFKENQVLHGTMNFTSNRVDLNEWMEEEIVVDTATAEPLEIIAIPKNIDFVLNSSINEVFYTNLILKNMKGRITVKDGVASLDNVNFSTLDGQFGMNGFYNTQNPIIPTFDFKLNIRDLSVAKAYEAFNTVQA